MSAVADDFTPEEMAQRQRWAELFGRLQEAAEGASLGDVLVAALWLAIDAGDALPKPMDDATITKCLPNARKQLIDWRDYGFETMAQTAARKSLQN